MNVLVTGASGFVGQHLVRVLRGRGDEVSAWGLAGAGEGFAAVDMREAAVVRAQDLGGVDAVIHLAGLAEVSGSFDRPAEYVCTNPVMQVNLMEALLAQRSSATVLVVSSGAVYAGGGELLTELSPVRASNPYVVSKLTQELLASYYTERGLRVIVARPFNHAGPGQQPGFLVADIASRLARLEREGGGALTTGNLQTLRDYSDVRDVAAAYAQLITDGWPGETYNVCSGVSRSGREILEGLLGLVSVPVTLGDDAGLYRPTDTLEVRASNQKLCSHTRWRPAIPLEVTLSDTLEYWRARVQGSPAGGDRSPR
ncbi:MAG: NAD-dependent epimerase/dehydratase family protein [Actinomycetota bacterium]|nr:NAD-dependent epimerase/dehydratase family protein [Actinomycetota bacterium]